MHREPGTAEPFSEGINRLIRLIALSLDEDANGASLANDACMSRFHFQRTFRIKIGETPVALRRRLLLERAAYQLQETRHDVTFIAIDAGYESLEGFCRSFRRAFHVTPGHYRRLAPLRFRLLSTNGIHYDPGTRGLHRSTRKGECNLDLTDRLMQHDAWMTRRLLEHAATLTNEQLDCVNVNGPTTVPWEMPEQTLRKSLNRLVFTKEVWAAAVRGHPMPDDSDVSAEGLINRLDSSFAEFAAIVREVRDAGKWDETFVDGVCTPPETFTYGGMIAHVITYSACRRQAVLRTMEALGIGDLSHGDPLDWEMAMREGTGVQS